MNAFYDRAYRTEDAAAVADLLNLICKISGGRLVLPAAVIENSVRAEIPDAERDTRVITDSTGRLLAFALVRLPPVGGFRVCLTGGVHPDQRRMGIGRELLDWQLERASARHLEAAPSMGWLAEVDAGLTDNSAIRLYERLGFARERLFLEMSAPTTSPSIDSSVEGFRVVPFVYEREREVHALHSATFRGSWGHQERDFEEWAGLTVRSYTFLPKLARLALIGDEVAGYVLPYVDGPKTLYIGQIGVAQRWRRRGLAGALLADLLGAAGLRGYTNAALETEADSAAGASRLYEKVGFITNQRVVVYHKSL